MFDGVAFRTWGHVVVGAGIVALLFLAIMLMVEEVVGTGARLSPAVLIVTGAAFVGYMATAWIIRTESATDG